MSEARAITEPASLNEQNATASTVRDYLDLLKPGVMRLVVFSAVVGLLIAPGDIHPFAAIVAILCITVASGAAAAINNAYDADIDRIMRRTAWRPTAAGRIDPADALAFGLVLSIGSIAVMGLGVNWTAAALLALTIGFYVVIYTMWLKRRTPQNIVIGGAAGAFPPMVGYAAVTGSVTVESAALFLLIFMWTPPHFWALALFRNRDYTSAGVPMLPVTDGEEATRRHIFAYAVLLALTSLLPLIIGMSGWLYGAAALYFGARFTHLCWQLYRAYDERLAKRTFGFSILYLFGMLGAILLDHLLYRFVL